MSKYLIYGDIGGTKTILQMAKLDNGIVIEHSMLRYHSSDYASFTDLLSDFLKEISVTQNNCHPTAACFAVAGPVVNQHVNLTNLPWKIDASAIAQLFSIPAVKLLNDFEAAALAIETLSSNDWVTLQHGCPQPQAMRVVLGAGTGMGVAWLVWQKDGYRPLSTEAGHIDFAPVNALQVQLLEVLQQKYQHVSVERILSGSGLTNIFNFLQTHVAEFSNLEPVILKEDSGAAVTALAFNNNHPVAVRSLEVFAEIYGAYAGNLALAGLCHNGVYIAGGIAPKIISVLSAGHFINAFCNKGRFSQMMRNIPVKVVTNAVVSLLGARKEAQYLLQMQN